MANVDHRAPRHGRRAVDDRDAVDAARYRALRAFVDATSLRVMREQASTDDRADNARALDGLADTLRGAQG